MIRLFNEASTTSINLNELKVWVNGSNILFPNSASLTGYFALWSNKEIDRGSLLGTSPVSKIYNNIIESDIGAHSLLGANALIIKNIPLTFINDIQAIVLYNRTTYLERVIGLFLELYNSTNDPNLTTPLATTNVITSNVVRYRYDFPSLYTYTGSFATANSTTNIVSNSIASTEEANFTPLPTFTGDLSVTGNETVTGTLSVTEATTLSSLSVTGDTALNKTTIGIDPEKVVSLWSGVVVSYFNWRYILWVPELRQYVARAQNTTLVSSDGITWTSVNGYNADIFSFVWAPEHNKFVGVSTSVSVTSADGITWVALTSWLNVAMRNLIWVSELFLFVATGGNKLYTSPDGLTWTEVVLEAVDYRKMAWSPELARLVVTGDNFVLTTSDAVTWTKTIVAGNLQSVTWSPQLSLFVAVGNAVILTSADGTTFTARTNNGNTFIDVLWGDVGMFVAVSTSGTNNRLSTSPDGVTWTSRSSVQDNTWSKIAYSPELGQFVVIGASGTNRIIRSFPQTFPHLGIGANHSLSSVSVKPLSLGTKMTLFDGGSNVNHHGFGISKNQMNYHVDPYSSHVFYAGGKNGDGQELMRINGEDGNTIIRDLQVNGTFRGLSLHQFQGFPENTVDTFGVLGTATSKWVGGVLAPNGKIYGIPHDSGTVLVIDPITNTVDTFGVLPGGSKWVGGVLAPNGKIYGIPFNSGTVLVINTGLPVYPPWMLEAYFNKF